MLWSRRLTVLENQSNALSYQGLGTDDCLQFYVLGLRIIEVQSIPLHPPCLCYVSHPRVKILTVKIDLKPEDFDVDLRRTYSNPRS